MVRLNLAIILIQIIEPLIKLSLEQKGSALSSIKSSVVIAVNKLKLTYLNSLRIIAESDSHDLKDAIAIAFLINSAWTLSTAI